MMTAATKNNNATSNAVVLGTKTLKTVDKDITVVTTAPKRPDYVTFNYGDMLSMACKYVTKQRMLEMIMTFINNCLNNIDDSDRVIVTEQYGDDPDDDQQYRITKIRIPNVSDKIKDYIGNGVVLDYDNNVEYIGDYIDCYDADTYYISITCKTESDFSGYHGDTLYVDIQDYDVNMW